jgi:hypothetical protein
LGGGPWETTYRVTWAASPEALRVAVEAGEVPNPDAEQISLAVNLTDRTD